MSCFSGVSDQVHFQSLTGEFSFCIRRVDDSVNCELSEALQGPFLGMKLEKEKINVVLLTAEMSSDVDICSVSRRPWLSRKVFSHFSSLS